MKHIIFIAVILFGSYNLSAQELQWTSFEDLPQLQKDDPRPVLIFIHTSWCKFCKMQTKISFKDPEIVEFLHKNYYSLKLDAESKQPIEFLNRTYHFNPSEGHHQLALTLNKGNGTLEFPTTILLNEHFQIQKQLSSYQGPNELLNNLKVLQNL